MNETPARGIDVPPKIEVRKGRKKQHGEIVPRRRPVYPISAERENIRAALAYTDMALATIQPEINRIMRAYEERESYHQDDTGDFITTSRGLRFAAAERLSKKTGALKKLEKETEKSGIMAKRHSIRDWNELVKDAFGVDVNEEYYDNKLDRLVDQWIHENVSLITSIPTEYLNNVEAIIRWGYETRQPKVNVYRKLEKLIGLTRSKARLIARDQLGSLNSKMTQFEHESAGVGKYKWITKRDSRVRDCHRALHGTIHKWSEPPAQWYMTKSRGIVYTGYAHPGEAIYCRCTAAPVFDIDIAKVMLADKFKPL